MRKNSVGSLWLALALLSSAFIAEAKVYFKVRGTVVVRPVKEVVCGCDGLKPGLHLILDRSSQTFLRFPDMEPLHAEAARSYVGRLLGTHLKGIANKNIDFILDVQDCPPDKWYSLIGVHTTLYGDDVDYKTAQEIANENLDGFQAYGVTSCPCYDDRQ